MQAKIIKIVDVSYGGENGFNQAIELSSDSLANVKFIQEKKLIGKSLGHLWHLKIFTVYWGILTRFSRPQPLKLMCECRLCDLLAPHDLVIHFTVMWLFDLLHSVGIFRLSAKFKFIPNLHLFLFFCVNVILISKGLWQWILPYITVAKTKRSFVSHLYFEWWNYGKCKDKYQ